MAKERTFTNKLLLFLKGLAMGAANKVPGVSGGTVAFVADFYEEMIYSFQKINKKAFLLLLSGRFRSFYQYINGSFLVVLFAGSMFSYFSVSRILDYFLTKSESSALFVWSFFFGMIIGSIYYIARGFKDWNAKNIFFIGVGIVIGIAISFMSPAKENDNLWFVFACGIIGVSGMTLPGLSGSFILILLGNYVLLLVDSVNVLAKTLTQVFKGDFSFLDDLPQMHYLKIIAAFTAGSAFGLVVTSHILGYLLKRWHAIITSLIIGFITGSLGIVWPWKKELYKIENGVKLKDIKGHYIVENYHRFMPDFGNKETQIALFFVVLGIVLILALDYFGNKNKRLHENS